MKQELSKSDFSVTLLDHCLESAIIEHAIKTFPFAESLLGIPPCIDQSLDCLLHDLLSTGLLKIGFYYDKLQDNLSIFYFLREEGEVFSMLDVKPYELKVTMDANIKAVFGLSEEQYINLLGVTLCWMTIFQD